jgi:hypothetical protein
VFENISHVEHTKKSNWFFAYLIIPLWTAWSYSIEFLDQPEMINYKNTDYLCFDADFSGGTEVSHEKRDSADIQIRDNRMTQKL